MILGGTKTSALFPKHHGNGRIQWDLVERFDGCLQSSWVQWSVRWKVILRDIPVLFGEGSIKDCLRGREGYTACGQKLNITIHSFQLSDELFVLGIIITDADNVDGRQVRPIVRGREETNVGGNVSIRQNRFLVSPVHESFEVLVGARPCMKGTKGIGQFVGLGLDLGDNAKIRSSPTNRKEEIGFLILRADMDRPVGSHNGNLDDIVSRCSVSLGLVADATRQKQAATSVADDSEWHMVGSGAFVYLLQRVAHANGGYTSDVVHFNVGKAFAHINHDSSS
mmetsp:Transcript_5554/g.10416  ORF Transcript_5554/g.10416 Transcript_5554/m.10416 type:complete len:281 (+) Transcript_5554:533-1375(+)